MSESKSFNISLILLVSSCEDMLKEHMEYYGYSISRNLRIFQNVWLFRGSAILCSERLM